MTKAATIIAIHRHLAEAKSFIMQAARSRSANDNAPRDERLLEIEDTLVRYGVLQPGMRLLVDRALCDSEFHLGRRTTI